MNGRVKVNTRRLEIGDRSIPISLFFNPFPPSPSTSALSTLLLVPYTAVQVSVVARRYYKRLCSRLVSSSLTLESLITGYRFFRFRTWYFEKNVDEST